MGLVLDVCLTLISDKVSVFIDWCTIALPNYYIYTAMSYQQKQKVQKVMVQPINLIFRYLQSRARVQVWLYENQNLRIEGHIIGFDEYMNVMLDQAEEVHMKKETRKHVGRILLKGDNITLIQNTVPDVGESI